MCAIQQNVDAFDTAAQQNPETPPPPPSFTSAQVTYKLNPHPRLTKHSGPVANGEWWCWRAPNASSRPLLFEMFWQFVRIPFGMKRKPLTKSIEENDAFWSHTKGEPQSERRKLKRWQWRDMGFDPCCWPFSFLAECLSTNALTRNKCLLFSERTDFWKKIDDPCCNDLTCTGRRSWAATHQQNRRRHYRMGSTRSRWDTRTETSISTLNWWKRTKPSLKVSHPRQSFWSDLLIMKRQKRDAVTWWSDTKELLCNSTIIKKTPRWRPHLRDQHHENIRLLTPVFKELFLVQMFLEHLDKFCDVILSPCILQFHPLISIYQVFDSQQCCFGFPRSSPHLVAIPKMILLLVQVHRVNHFAKKL